jgi:phosphoenolpyruvate carboxykinase (GTP)
MAMLPFCGYNVGNYFAHWLDIGQKLKRPPRIFMVNWFRKDAGGNFLWPGYGENLRVLKWMLERTHGSARANETPVGLVPDDASLDLTGLEISRDRLRQALAIDAGEWRAELASSGEFFDRIGRALPGALREKHQMLAAALDGSASARKAV